MYWDYRTDFRRQNLTSEVGPRAKRVKSIIIRIQYKHLIQNENI